MSHPISLISVEKNDLFQRIKSFVAQLLPHGSWSDLDQVRTRADMIRAGIVLPPFDNNELWLTIDALLLCRVPLLILDRASTHADMLRPFLKRSDWVYYAAFRESGFYDPLFHFLMSVRDKRPIVLSLNERQQRTSLLPITTPP